MQWLDGHGAGYLAWSWNAFGACVPSTGPRSAGSPYSLITDYTSGSPQGTTTVMGISPTYAQAFHDHVVGLP
jgi:hypothetical protein